MKLAHAIGLCLLANWSAVHWLLLRYKENNWHHLIALFTLLYFLLKHKKQSADLSSRNLYISLTLSFVGNALSILGFPPILQACLLAINLTFLISPVLNSKWHWSSFALLILALPIMSSIQFFLGYPIRIIVSKLSSFILNLGGVNTRAHGTTLEWNGIQTIVDAPCSGINMLWASLFLSSIICFIKKVDTKRFWQIQLLSIALIIMTNAFRCSALFYLENANYDFPEISHSGIGLLLFAIYAYSLNLIDQKVNYVH